MLGDRHQLDVREAEVGDVRGELVGQFAVRQPRPPGGQVDLVHRHRRLVRGRVGAAGQPLLVPPRVVRGVDDGRGGRRDLRGTGQRIGAEGARAVGAGDLELVQLARADAGQEQLPHTGGTERPHGVAGAVPEVEAAGHPDPARVRRPHREAGARDAVVRHRVRAERLPQLLVPALADQVQVQLAQCGQEAVRVLDLLHRLLVRHAQPVQGDLPQRQQPGEEAVPVVVQPDAKVAGEDGHLTGVRPQGPEGDPAGHPVGAEHGVGVVVRAGQQPLPVAGVQGGGDGDLDGGSGGLPGSGLPGGRLLGGGLLGGGLLRHGFLRQGLVRHGPLRGALLRRGLLHAGLRRPGPLGRLGRLGGLLRGRLLRGGLLVGRLLRGRLLGGRLLRVGTAGRGAGGHGWSLLGEWEQRRGCQAGSGADRRRTAASGTGSQSGRCRASYRTS